MKNSASILVPNVQASSLRRSPGTGDRNLLGLAALISVLFHVASYFALESGLMKTIDNFFSPPQEARIIENAVPESIEIPLVYVEVNPEHASPEVPEDTEFYSARNSLAANPDAMIDSEQPNIDGEQSDYLKTEDVPVDLSAPMIIQELTRTDPSPNEPPAVVTVEVRNGDLVNAEPNSENELDDKANPEANAPPLFTSQESQEQTRPRTLIEARMLAGEKSQQLGGVTRRRSVSLVDAKGTTFGAYDEFFTLAVQQRWYALLEMRRYTYSGSGTVVVKFRLNSDGKISNSKIESNSIGDINLGIICVSAIHDPAPYPEWPEQMRRDIGENWRDLTFTFHYR